MINEKLKFLFSLFIIYSYKSITFAKKIHMYRIKEVAKRKNIQMQEIVKQLGITKQSLNSKINKGMNTKGLEDIAKILNCELAELISVGDEFTHFYDEQGRWLGIVRKYPYSQEADSMQLKERFEQEQPKEGEE